MGDDDAADRVGVDYSHVENKRDEVLLENDRLLVKVKRDESPCYEERNKTSKRGEWVLAVLFSGFDYVQNASCKNNLAKLIMIMMII